MPLLAVGMLFASCAKEEGPSRNSGKYLAQERAKFDDKLTEDEQTTLEVNAGLDNQKSVDAVLAVASRHSSDLSFILRDIDPEDFYDCEDYEPKGCEDVEQEWDDDDCDWDFDIDWGDCEEEEEDNTSTTTSGNGSTNTTNGAAAPDFTQYSGEQIKCMNFLVLEPS